MKIEFTKMHGIGNDYIYIDMFKHSYAFDPSKLAIEMSARHFSVGSDGLVLICPSDVADCRMAMYNADGSEGKMCGNAVRCIGKYIYDSGLTDKKSVTVETLSGIKTLLLEVKKGVVERVTVDMGRAETTPERIPVLSAKPLIDAPIEVSGKTYRASAVSMGNPHCVIFTENVAVLDLEKSGKAFEYNQIFPERVNTEFAEIIGENEIFMRVWERGSGETYACGTGACATAVAAVLTGRCRANEKITVKLLGGSLEIVVDGELNVKMKGAATRVYDGVYYYEN